MSERSRARRTAGSRAVGAGAPLAAATAAWLMSPAAHASEGGLVLAPDWPILIGLVVFFLALVMPLNRLLFQPVFRVLDEREKRIAGTRARAAQLERGAEQALARYESSIRSVREESEQARRALLETARSEGLAATGEARAQVEREVETARADIGRALESASATLRGEAQELARQAASRVLGRPL